MTSAGATSPRKRRVELHRKELRRRLFKIRLRVLAARLHPSCSIGLPSLQEEGAGNAGRWPHPWPACNKKSRRQSPQVRPDQPAFPARWFTAYIAISPGTGLSCPRRLRDDLANLSLSVGRPGPRDFTVRI